MNHRALLSAAGVALLAFSPCAGHAAELLLNGNFEGPLVVGGMNNLGTVPTSWTVENGTGTVDAAVSNLTHGVVTNGNGNTGANNLPLDPYDTGVGDAQSLDISGSGYVYQDFSLPAGVTAPVTVKIDFGGRDAGSDTSTGSFWQIIDTTNSNVVASSQSSPVQPAFGGWSTSVATTGVSLTGGVLYRFLVTLDDPDHVDGASITAVPEPSTLAAAIGAGVLGWIGCQRRRRA